MKSITDLNGIGLDTNDYIDQRTPSITFSTLTPATQSLTIYQGAPHSLPVGSNITEIINYPFIGACYIIDLRNTLLDCQVQWATIPSGCVVTNPTHNVWKISGINSAVTWNLIKSPTIIINEEVYGSFSYMATIEYQTTNYVSWNVSTTILQYDVLSAAYDFSFENGVAQKITGNPVVYDYSVQQPNWTVTVTPNSATGITAVSTVGSGGTVSINPTTRVITISGTKTQVNSHLNSMYFTFSSTNTSSFVLTYYAINATATKNQTVTQNLICETVRYLGLFTQTGSYSEDVPFVLSGLPQITDNESTASEGNTPKTLSINSSMHSMSSSGTTIVNSGRIPTNAYDKATEVYYNGNNMSGSVDRRTIAENSTIGDITTPNFTIEFFLYAASGMSSMTSFPILSKSQYTGLENKYGTTGNEWSLRYDPGVNSFHFHTQGSYINNSSGSMTFNAWNHIAIVRTNTNPNDVKACTYAIYINGTRVLLSSQIETGYIGFSNNQNLTVGYTITAYSMIGVNYAINESIRISDVRFSDIARYSGTSFTAPSTASHLLVDGNTTTLVQLEAATSYDLGQTASIKTTFPKFGAGSLAFTNGNLSVNASEDWVWYNTDYTVESFIRGNSVTGNFPLNVGLMESTGIDNYWSFGIDSAHKGHFFYFDGAERHIVGTTVLSLSDWHHIAVTFQKKSNTITLFVNGVAEASHTVTGTPRFASIPLQLGAYNSNFAKSYMDEVRISKTCRYINNFTVPTIAFTADNYTNLLLHGDGYNGSVITDSSTSVSPSNYTYTLTAAALTAIRNATSTGVGGTFSYSNGVTTLVGTRSQINNRLSTITLVPGSDYTSSFTLTCQVTTPAAKVRSAVITYSNIGIHSEVSSNITLSRVYTPNVASSIFASNTPQITDLDSTNPSFTITLVSTTGKFGTTAGNAVTNYSYTGTKDQINALFPTLIYLTASTTTDNFTYTQTKGGVQQVSATGSTRPIDVIFSPASVPSGSYTSYTKTEGSSFTLDWLSNPTQLNSGTNVTVVIQPINVTNSSSFSWNVAWSGLSAGVTKTVNGNVITLTGINSLAEWDTVKTTATASLNNYYNGAFTIQTVVSWTTGDVSGTVAWNQNMTITDVYPLSSITSSYTYNAGSSITLSTNGLLPSIVDSGNTNPTWTLTLTPSMLNSGMSYVGFIPTAGVTSSITNGVLTVVGTAGGINFYISNMAITTTAGYGYDLSFTWNATNSSNSETGTRSFNLVNINTTVLSLASSTQSFTANTAYPCHSNPTITATETGKYTLSVFPNDTTAVNSLSIPTATFQYGSPTTNSTNINGIWPYYLESYLSPNGKILVRINRGNGLVSVRELDTGIMGSITCGAAIYGVSVKTSYDGNIIYVGAIGETVSGISKAGRVYVYTRDTSTGNLTQSSTVIGSQNTEYDSFGLRMFTCKDVSSLVAMRGDFASTVENGRLQIGSQVITEQTASGGFGMTGAFSNNGLIMVTTSNSNLYVYTRANTSSQFVLSQSISHTYDSTNLGNGNITFDDTGTKFVVAMGTRVANTPHTYAFYSYSGSIWSLSKTLTYTVVNSLTGYYNQSSFNQDLSICHFKNDAITSTSSNSRFYTLNTSGATATLIREEILPNETYPSLSWDNTGSNYIWPISFVVASGIGYDTNTIRSFYQTIDVVSSTYVYTSVNNTYVPNYVVGTPLIVSDVNDQVSVTNYKDAINAVLGVIYITPFAKSFELIIKITTPSGTTFQRNVDQLKL